MTFWKRQSTFGGGAIQLEFDTRKLNFVVAIFPYSCFSWTWSRSAKEHGANEDIRIIYYQLYLVMLSPGTIAYGPHSACLAFKGATSRDYCEALTCAEVGKVSVLHSLGESSGGFYLSMAHLPLLDLDFSNLGHNSNIRYSM